MAIGQDALDKIASAKAALEALDLRLDDVRSNVAALKTEIQALKDQLAAGSPVTPEQLEAIVAGLGEIESAVSARVEEAAEAAV